MEMKEMLANLLKKVSDSMVNSAPASYAGVGVEEMPKSIKKLR